MPKKKYTKESELNQIMKCFEEFLEGFLENYEKYIKAIWMIRKEKEFFVYFLIDNISFDTHEDLGEMELALYKKRRAIRNRYNIQINPIIITLSQYYKDLLENKLELLIQLKQASPLYDPSGFFLPIKRLLDTGELKKTKERMFRLVSGVRHNMRKVYQAKLEALSNLFTAVIDAAEAALLTRGITFVVPKEIPKLLEKEFLKEKMISRRTIEIFQEIYDYYKAYEHHKIKEIDGKKLEKLINHTEKFIYDMEYIIRKRFQSEKIQSLR